MAPNPRIRIAESVDVVEEEEYVVEEVNDEEDERPERRYYRSENVLGRLYRNINEQEFLDELRNASKLQKNDTTVLRAIWEYVKSETEGFQWDHLIEDAEKAKDMYVTLYRLFFRFVRLSLTYQTHRSSRYEDYLRELMQNYSKTPWKSSLTEIEVFVGSILGQNSKQSRRDKEASKRMKDGT